MTTPPACPMPRRDYRWMSMIALGIMLAFLLIFENHHISRSHFGAMATYYVAANDLRAGRSPYTPHNGVYAYVYPPLFAFLLQPLTHFGLPGVARIMAVVMCCTLVASMLFAVGAVKERLLQPPYRGDWWHVVMLAAAIVFAALFRQTMSLQTDALLLLSFTATLYWLDRRPLVAGIFLAFGICIKYSPAIAIPYLIWRRRWKCLVGCSIGMLLWSALPAISAGWTANLRNLSSSNAGIAAIAGLQTDSGGARVHSISSPLNISVTSSLMRLAESQQWPRGAAIALTLLAAGIWLLILIVSYRPQLAIAGRTEKLQRHQPVRYQVLLEWTALMTAALAFSPNGEMVFWLPSAILLAALLTFPVQAGVEPELLLSLVLGVAALLLPIACIGHQWTTRWNQIAAGPWLLLIATALLFRSGMRRIADIAAAGNDEPSSTDLIASVGFKPGIAMAP